MVCEQNTICASHKCAQNKILGNWKLYYDAMNAKEYLKVLQAAEEREAKKQKELK